MAVAYGIVGACTRVSGLVIEVWAEDFVGTVSFSKHSLEGAAGLARRLVYGEAQTVLAPSRECLEKDTSQLSNIRSKS